MYQSRVPVGAMLACSALLLVAAGAVFVHMRPAGPAPAVMPAPEPPPPPPQPHWSDATLRQLLDAVDGAAAEGLRPADYGEAPLREAIAEGRSAPEIEALATRSAKALAHDYADGHVRHRARFDWHIGHSQAPLATLDADLANAVNGGRLTDYLRGLLPTDPRYRALRGALGDADAPARRNAIRASMERWRWMPRVLGQDYIWVNLPTYRLQLYRAGTVAASHVVVVGAPRTPTPMLSAAVSQIIVNPWWTLPPTVLREGKTYAPARGYVWQTIGGRTYVRQKPGPMNALGRMKIDMPNPWAIYLHDTPAKSGFLQTNRALSHGCIRVEGITTLGAELHDPTAIGKALETRVMKTLPVETRVPVYIVYFTAAPNAAGTVVTYGDPYGRDAPLIAALDGVRYRPPPKKVVAEPAPILEPATASRAADEPSRANP